ncbi:MAG TPA: Lrp/AsnC ligand binding domain-containing protein [Bacteroidales bacterium]|nr:Lrp/AsnC ligand binding domain-containing protein [Bacteroidales bacterium]HPS17140.1 Lrp/AsnC ligand binding domain-containing protein [Bacteroidales bacterium]
MKNSSANFHIDSLDKKILSILTKDARTPFVEVARTCGVSGAAIHQRVQQMISAGVIKSSQFNISPRAMGYNTCAFIGIQLHLITRKSHIEAFDKIMKVPEIVECHHVSGKHSLLIKIYTKSNEDLKDIIIEKIQSIPEVISTETFISLQEGFERQVATE